MAAYVVFDEQILDPSREGAMAIRALIIEGI